MTSNVPTIPTSNGRFLGARPRDSTNLRRANAFRNPADGRAFHGRSYRDGGSGADVNYGGSPGVHGSSLTDPSPSTPTNHSFPHQFRPIVSYPLRRTHATMHLPTCLVRPMPRPAPRLGRSLVALSQAAGADPALLIEATVSSSSLPPLTGPPTVDPFPPHGSNTDVVGSEEQPDGDYLSNHGLTGNGLTQEESGSDETSEAAGAAGGGNTTGVSTPTNVVNGVTFGAVSGGMCIIVTTLIH